MSDAGLRVLLVEDDEEDYIIARDLFSDAGRSFDLEWVDRLGKAVERLGREGVDVVLLDLTLPDSQGLETFRRLHGVAPEVPMILLTGFADENLGVQAVKEGAQDYLFKGTTDRHHLVRAVRYAIERKRTESSLRGYRERLEEMVQERTGELRSANSRLKTEIETRSQVEEELRRTMHSLEAHVKARSEFVTSVSHELRTPLASMGYAVENLLKGVVGPVSPRVRDYLLMMREDTERLKRTVDDILDLSRIDATKLVLSRVRLAFGRFVRQAVASMRLQIDAKSMRLAIDAPDGIGFVDCDAHKLERVIFNILHNALKYTAEGGTLELRVSTRPVAEATHVVLDVTDNGIGIPPEHIARVTERYYRVGEHVTGSGLGLSLVKEIVELHGGAIEILSPPPGRQRGTRVSISLPTVAAPTVLAADADAVSLDRLERELSAHGYCVLRSSSGDEALRAVLERRCDILVADSMLPGVDGVEIVSRLKRDPALRNVPMAIVTGGEMNRARRETLDRYGVSALAKPWRGDELLTLVEESVLGSALVPRGR